MDAEKPKLNCYAVTDEDWFAGTTYQEAVAAACEFYDMKPEDFHEESDPIPEDTVMKFSDPPPEDRDAVTTVGEELKLMDGPGFVASSEF